MVLAYGMHDDQRLRREQAIFAHLGTGVGHVLPEGITTLFGLTQTIPPQMLNRDMPPAAKTGLPQTAAYLSIPELRTLVETSYGGGYPGYEDKYLVYKDTIIKYAMDREREFYDTHYVCYHAQNARFLIMYDLIREVNKWLISRHDAQFFGLRVPSDFFKITDDIFAFVDQKMKETGFNASFDSVSNINAYLVSVNLALFGNTDSYGEDTFGFFVRNQSFLSPQKLVLIQDFLKQMRFSEDAVERYSRQISALMKTIRCEAKTGLLFQIFIPRNTINNYAYLAAAYGLYGDVESNKTWFTAVHLHGIEKPMILSEYLELYRNAPGSLIGVNPEIRKPQEYIINLLQARLLMTINGLLNPATGIKIFRYMDIDEDCRKRYLRELAQIVKAIMLDWYKTIGFDAQKLKKFVEKVEAIPQDFTPKSIKKMPTHAKPTHTRHSCRVKPWVGKKKKEKQKRPNEELNLLAEALAALHATIITPK